jgi:Ca-activated chloride channel family protein
MNKGKSNFDRTALEKSVKHFERAVAMDSSDAKANYNLADAYLAIDSISLAQQYFNKSLVSTKDKSLNAKAYHNLGVIEQALASASKDKPAAQQNCLRKAIDNYKSSLRLNPESEETRYNLALCLKQLKETKQEQQNDSSQQQQEKKEQKQIPQQKQNDQLMEYAKRKEKETREKMRATYVSPSREKNW